MNQELIERIVAEAIRQLEQSGCVVLPNRTEEELVPQPCEDIVSPACQAVPHADCICRTSQCGRAQRRDNAGHN